MNKTSAEPPKISNGDVTYLLSPHISSHLSRHDMTCLSDSPISSHLSRFVFDISPPKIESQRHWTKWRGPRAPIGAYVVHRLAMWGPQHWPTRHTDVHTRRGGRGTTRQGRKRRSNGRGRDRSHQHGPSERSDRGRRPIALGVCVSVRDARA